MRSLVRHAASQVPYYRELFRRAGLDRRDFRTAADLSRIPVTTKTELQARPLREFLSEGVDASKLLRFATSGSTGRPTVVLRTRWEQLQLQAYRLRSQRLCGVRPGDLRVNIHSRWQGMRPPARLGLYRMEVIGHGEPLDVLEKLSVLRGDVLLSRPAILEALAREARRLSIEPAPCRLLFSAAEIMTPPLRELFADAWKCRVFDEYGANEFVLVSAECPECGLQHTCDDAVVVEVLGDDGAAAAPGERGRVVGTALHSYAMPFLRFDLDDIAVRPAEPSSCSTVFGSIQVLEGRRMDLLRLPDGAILSPYSVQRAIQEVPGIRRFQVDQPAPEELVVLLEADSDDAVSEVRGALRLLVPETVRLDVERGDLPPERPESKRRYIRSASAAATEPRSG